MKVVNDPRVDKEIRCLPRSESAKIVRVIELFSESGFNLAEPYLKKLARNIWELRASRWRLLFGIVKSKAVIVNIFLKKTQKTPKREVSLAIKRLGEYL